MSLFEHILAANYSANVGVGEGAGDGLEALAISDFKNGIYSIGGVSKTFAEMWSVLGTGLGASVVADVGYHMEGAATSSASATLQATGDLFTAVHEFGCTAVIDCSATVTPADATGEVEISLQLSNSVSADSEWWHWTVGGPSAAAAGMAIAEQDNGAASGWIYLDPDPSHQGTKRVAVTYHPTHIDASLDGAAAIERAVAYADWNVLSRMRLGHFALSTTSGATTVAKITFYAPQDAADLPALSA